LLAAVMLLTLLRPTGYLQPLEDIVATMLAPVQYSLEYASATVTGWLETLRDVGSLQARVRELEETVDSLMVENVRLREAEIERAHLRELLQFKMANPAYESLAAEVIGRDPSNLLHYVTVDRGSDDGIAIGMPVVTARGLVGSVISVYPTSARVMLLTEVASSVSALVQSSRATGVVQGQAQRGMVMRYVEQSVQVQVGDIILTSGLGGNFPKGLLIGQVTAVDRNDVDMFQEVQLRSAVDFDRLESVLVIQSFEPID
jgi:rod shape-determining protein MreC